MTHRMRLLTAMFLYASAARAVDWTALKPQGYVSDFAGVVDATGKKQLEAYCAAVEQATGAKIALVTIASLEREPIEDVTQAIFRAWNLDQKAPKNAVIWLVAVANRRDYMQTGAGLAGILPASATDAILREARPALADQHYAQALMSAVDEIGSRIAAADHKTIAVRLPKRAPRSVIESIPWLLAAGILLLCFWLFRTLGRPPRHIRAGGGFGGGETGGW
jgi:uncharacterized protein